MYFSIGSIKSKLLNNADLHCVRFLKFPISQTALSKDLNNVNCDFVPLTTHWYRFEQHGFKQLNIFLKPKNCVIQGLAVLPYLINYLLLDTWQPYLIPLWHHFCISFHLCAKCSTEKIDPKKFIFWFHYEREK